MKRNCVHPVWGLSRTKAHWTLLLRLHRKPTREPTENKVRTTKNSKTIQLSLSLSRAHSLAEIELYERRACTAKYGIAHKARHIFHSPTTEQTLFIHCALWLCDTLKSKCRTILAFVLYTAVFHCDAIHMCRCLCVLVWELSVSVAHNVSSIPVNHLVQLKNRPEIQ